MRWTLVLAAIAVGCGSGRETWPDPPQRAGRDAGPRVDARPPIDAGIPLDTRGMVLVPGGDYLAGPAGPDARGEPVAKASARSFYIDKTEVTVAEYAACVSAGACAAPTVGDVCTPEEANWGHPDRGQHPINCVSFAQALTYCNWLGKRLPAKDEWEKAARGTDGRIYPWGNQPPTCKRAVIAGCTDRRTAPVGERPDGASPYGILDMAGNVAEITLGYILVHYEMIRRPITVAGLVLAAEFGEARGGGFADNANARVVRVWESMSSRPATDVGFRCAAPPRR